MIQTLSVPRSVGRSPRFTPIATGASLRSRTINLGTSGYSKGSSFSIGHHPPRSSRSRTSPALVAAIKQALGPPEKTQTPLETHAEFREVARTELHQRLFLPRIGSGAFAAMCALLFTVGEKFKEDPLVGLWIQSRTGKLAIFVSMLYSALFFAMTWWMEQTATARAEWLATEDGRRHLFGNLLHEVRPHLSSPEDPEASCFSFSDLVHVIRGRARHGLPLPFLPRGLSGAAAEKLAKAHLDELEARGVVQRLPGKRLDVLYKMDADAAEEMRHGFHEWT